MNEAILAVRIGSGVEIKFSQGTHSSTMLHPDDNNRARILDQVLKTQEENPLRRTLCETCFGRAVCLTGAARVAAPHARCRKVVVREAAGGASARTRGKETLPDG